MKELSLLLEKHLPKKYYGHEARKHAKDLAVEYSKSVLNAYLQENNDKTDKLSLKQFEAEI